MQKPPPHEGDPDRYASIADGPELELRVQGSRFLARAFQATTFAAAEAALSAIRRLHHSATHHCSAVRLGPPEGPYEQSDDDGEPSGTAGLPILGALRRASCYDASIVVTRYFGGTKLGTGGLVRAYGDAARAALEAAPGREVWREEHLTVTCAYEDIGVVEAVLARTGDRVRGVEREFGREIIFRVALRRSHAAAFREELIEATAARARVSNAM
jgi:uncharacterized YigZ family protein